MSKSKHSPKFRANVSQKYIDGKGTYDSLADLYGISSTTLKKWVAVYRIHGIDAFITTIGNKSYSKKFKLYCVEEVIPGKGSAQDIAASVNIHPTVLERWIKMYNANRELREYIPKREVYMAASRRKTTIEERKEIVNYCINNDRNYKDTASLYDVSYSQVYSWVKKYDVNGEKALVDKRGHHKTDNELEGM